MRLTWGDTMLRRIIVGLLLSLPGVVSAQEGTIAYKHSVRLDFEISEEMRARFEGRGGNRRGGSATNTRGGRGSFPTERVSDVVLLFTGSASLMKPIPGARPARGRRGGGEAREARAAEVMTRLRMRSTSRSDRETLVEAHVGYAEGSIVEAREFLGRTFLIEDTRPSFEWRLTGEQAEFLGYVVQKATAEYDGSTVEAWFTPQIPVQGGPGVYGGLPGMILVVSVNDGHTQYTATDVSLAAVAEGVVVRPTEGEVVTREEYETIVTEKLEELRRTRGGTSR